MRAWRMGPYTLLFGVVLLLVLLWASKDYDPHLFVQYEKMKTLIQNFMNLDPGEQERTLIGNLLFKLFKNDKAISLTQVADLVFE